MSGEGGIRSRAELLSRPVRVFSVLILTIFSAELAVMMSFGVFLPELGQVAATLLDATLLSVLIAPVLWFVLRDRLVEAPVERLELVARDGALQLDGQLGHRLANVAVVVDDLRDGEARASR